MAFVLRRMITLAAALLATLCACGIEVSPFVVTSPGPADGGTPSVPDGGLFISSVAPINGPDTGGTTVIIGGGGFAPDASVLFGVIQATSATVSDPQTIFALTPPSPAGTVDVTVENPDGGAAVAPGAYTFDR